MEAYLSLCVGVKDCTVNISDDPTDSLSMLPEMTKYKSVILHIKLIPALNIMV